MPGRRARRGKARRQVFQNLPRSPPPPEEKRPSRVWPPTAVAFRALFSLPGREEPREIEAELYRLFQGIRSFATSANEAMARKILGGRLPGLVRAGPFSKKQLFSGLTDSVEIRRQAAIMGRALAEAPLLPPGIRWKPEWVERKTTVPVHLEQAVAQAQEAYLEAVWRWIMRGRPGRRPAAPDYMVIIPLALADAFDVRKRS
ncbi:MAG: hypothetical protein J4203_00725 [Candidatus Diapherotrites archaeon]|uniref:Uncharacterized protein n=1 Tax=Candidatus Iainarchaeum sp. TaxID=3101447 RepID=A0A8T4LCG8_9ARCH|nr:hypothetical protein [Candidatus Diapherotrites archaeon]